jgi:hypothetical protein
VTVLGSATNVRTADAPRLLSIDRPLTGLTNSEPDELVLKVMELAWAPAAIISATPGMEAARIKDRMVIVNLSPV